MARIRLVGRARGGRCVFCHDGLQGDVERCPECRAAWHEDCRPIDGHCHTLGCTAPAPLPSGRAGQVRIVEPALDRPIVDRFEPQAARSDPAWTIPRRQPGRRPGWSARVGPYSRLVVGGALCAAPLLALLGAVAVGLRHPIDLWTSLRPVEELEHPVPYGLLLLLLCGFTAITLPYLILWLRTFPKLFREVHLLLESTRPVLMDLTIEPVAEFGLVYHHAACLQGRHGEWANHRFQWRLGHLTPAWLSRAEGQPVLVYGLPSSGPYILELESGDLALVHPNQAERRVPGP